MRTCMDFLIQLGKIILASLAGFIAGSLIVEIIRVALF